MTAKLTAEQVREAIFHGSAYASCDGAQYYANGIGMQAIADELNATLGAGTCHATSNPPVPKHWTGCSNCGSVWDFFYNICGYMGPPNFCPKCGAKVVDA